MDDDVVRRVEPLAFERGGQDRRLALIFIAHDARRLVLARELPAARVEGVAVGKVRLRAQHTHRVGRFIPPHLTVVRDIAEHHISTDPVPRRPFCPESAGPFPDERRVADHVLPEPLVEDLPDAGRIPVRLWPDRKALRQRGRGRCRRARCRGEKRAPVDVGLFLHAVHSVARGTPLLMIGNFKVKCSIKVGQIRKIFNFKVAYYSISFDISQNG